MSLKIQMPLLMLRSSISRRKRRGPVFRERFVIVMVAVFILMLAPTAKASWYPYSEKYTEWQNGRPMTMAALHNCVPRDQLTDRMARFKAAGLNTFVWFKPGAAHDYFRAAHEAGISWAGGHRGGATVIAEALRIPGCAYLITADEPSGTMPEDFAEIAKLAEWLRQDYPNIPQYVQFSIAKADHDVLIEEVKPDIFSFDHYPLRGDNTTDKHYLYNVMWGRQTAQRYKLPYWMWIQSFGDATGNPASYLRLPDEADIRFLVFTLLAHGGTGIQFFIYYGYGDGPPKNVQNMVDDLQVNRPGSEPPKNHKYENTVKSRGWFAVRDVAPEVQVLARALLNLRSKDPVAYSGGSKLWNRDAPGYAIRPKVPFRLEAFEGHGALESAKIAEGEDTGVLVGFFDDKQNEEYFMVVNLAHGLNMSKMDGQRTVRLSFDGTVKQIERLNRFTGLVETLLTREGAADTRLIDIQLEGGTGDLFKWSNGRPWDLRK